MDELDTWSRIRIKQMLREYQRDRSLKLSHCYSQWRLILTLRDWTPSQNLYFDNIRINDDTIHQIMDRKWPNLESILASSNDLTPKGIHKILKYSWPKIRFLHLDNNIMGNQGIKILLKAELPNLQVLGLSNTKIGDEAIRNLTRATWKNFRSLSLKNNSIGVLGYQYLARMNWRKMQLITITSEQKQQNIQILGLILCIEQVNQFLSIDTGIYFQLKKYNETFYKDIKNTLQLRYPQKDL